MKRICFVSLGNLYLAPYLKSYTNLLNGNDYTIIYWDRENIAETYGRCEKLYRFRYSFSSAVGKLHGYFLFKSFVKKILKKGNYDLVVFLQTIGSILMGSYICKAYKNKYIVDIRDYSYEGNKIIYRIEKKVIKHSLRCVISSEGYKAFLPDHEYLIAHNTRYLEHGKVKKIRDREKNKSILNIAFIGFVNYQEQHKKILIALKNDDRFQLSFIGTKARELESFCNEHCIKNVTLIDRFDDKNILDYYSNVDLINNLYGNHTPTLDYALSNKLYFSAELYIPILTCKETFMSRIAHEYGFGFDVDTSDLKCGDAIMDYYKKINWNQLKKNCESFNNKVNAEQREFEETIRRIFN